MSLICGNVFFNLILNVPDWSWCDTISTLQLFVLAFHQTRAYNCIHQSFPHVIKARFVFGLYGNERFIFLFQNYTKSNANALLELSRLRENKYVGDEGDAFSSASSNVRKWKQIDAFPQPNSYTLKSSLKWVKPDCSLIIPHLVIAAIFVLPYVLL